MISAIVHREGFDMVTDVYGVIYTVAGMVIGGGIVHFCKRYTDQSDAQEKTLPVITKSIESIEEATSKIKDSISELYESRNKHSEQLTRIETIHRLKGCDKPIA